MSRIGVSRNLFRPQELLWVTVSVDIVDRDIVRKRVEEGKEDETNSNSH